MMAAQLLGTGGIAALLLLAAATALPAAVDVALTLALLAAFAAVAFVNNAPGTVAAERRATDIDAMRVARHLHGCRGFGGRRVLPGRHGRAAALPGLA